MALDGPHRPRVHLLTRLEGERFALEPGPDAEVYTLQSHRAEREGRPVEVLWAVDAQGVGWPLSEVARRNQGSYFVYSAWSERVVWDGRSGQPL